MSPPAWFLSALAGMLALHTTVPGARWLDAPWTFLGVVPIAGGIALHAWALRVFRAAGTTPEPEGRPGRLVRTGPYALGRNPMYLAGLPILAGWAALLGTTTPLLALPGYGLAAARWVGREETLLEARFGAEWGAYRAAVRRWI